MRSHLGNGTLTEWLGSGLQNRVQQFDSARYLQREEQRFFSFFEEQVATEVHLHISKYSCNFVNANGGSYQSGQMGLTVTQLSFDFGGSNPSLPTNFKKAEFLR